MKKSKPAPLFKTKNAAEECVRRLLRSATKRDAENAELRAQLAAAIERAEKAEGLVRQYEAVESSWDAQAVSRALELPLGSDIRAEILPAVVKLKQERDELRAQLCAARELFTQARPDFEGFARLFKVWGMQTAAYNGCKLLMRVDAVLSTPAPPCPHAEQRDVFQARVREWESAAAVAVDHPVTPETLGREVARIRAEERARAVAILDRCAPYLRMEWRNASMSYCAGVADLERMLRAEFTDGVATSQVQTLVRETKDDDRPDGGGAPKNGGAE